MSNNTLLVEHNKQSLAKYGDDFQLSTLKLFLEDSTLFKSVYEYLQPQYYSNEALALIYTFIKKYYDKYKHVPTFDMLKSFINANFDNLTKKGQDLSTLKNIVDIKLLHIQKKDTNRDKKYITDAIVEFCKQQAFLIAIEKSIGYANQENYDKIIPEFKSALTITTVDIGLIYKDTIRERYDVFGEAGRVRVVNTGLNVLDRLIDGGLGAGELGVIGAFTGIGKSSLMTVMGANAVKNGKTVAHLSYELPKGYVAKKYDCAFTGIRWRDLYAKRQQVENTVSFLSGKLILQAFPAYRQTLTSVESYLNSLLDRDMSPDLLILDYADCIIPRKEYKEKRDSLASLYDDIRGLGAEYQIPIWTATQFNRSSYDDQVADVNRIAESLGKAMTCDILLSLNRKKEDKANGTGILYIAKSRFGPDSVRIPLRIDLSSMSIEEEDGAEMALDQLEEFNSLMQ